MSGSGAWSDAALLVAAVAAGSAVAVLLPGAPRLKAARAARCTTPAGGEGWMRRRRWLLAALAALGAHQLLPGGPVALAGAVAAGGGSWWASTREEPAGERRRREAVRRELPYVVLLLGAALRGGAAPGPAVGVVCQALPGPAAERLGVVVARLDLGVDPVTVWAGLAGDDPELAPLGRVLARAHTTGAPVSDAVDRLAAELSTRSRVDVEDRARTVGVRAALPLGLCLLPAFLLIGIVPLVAGLMAGLLPG